MDYSDQYWLCYYRDGTLINSSKIARTPYTFRARNVTLSGVEIDTNLTMEGKNISNVNYGFFDYLGSLITRITKLWTPLVSAPKIARCPQGNCFGYEFPSRSAGFPSACFSEDLYLSSI